MKTQHTGFLLALLLVLVASTTVIAGDFGWADDLNIAARKDASGFRASLATRFRIGDADVNLVLSNVDSPADAYMIFRLGEMSLKPADHVLRTYKSQKQKGWGAIAKSLGIKPGSREFHELKRGVDLEHISYKSKGDKKKKNRKNKG